MSVFIISCYFELIEVFLYSFECFHHNSNFVLSMSPEKCCITALSVSNPPVYDCIVRNALNCNTWLPSLP